MCTEYLTHYCGYWYCVVLGRRAEKVRRGDGAARGTPAASDRLHGPRATQACNIRRRAREHASQPVPVGVPHIVLALRVML